MNQNEMFAVIGQMRDAITLLVQRVTFDDVDAVKISAFYPLWEKPKSYGNGTFLRWGTNEAGKPLLYVTTGNVAANGGAPDVTPGKYKLLG